MSVSKMRIFVCFIISWMGVMRLTMLFLLPLYTSSKECAPTRSSLADWVALFSMCCFMQAKRTDRIIELRGDLFLSRINPSVNHLISHITAWECPKSAKICIKSKTFYCTSDVKPKRQQTVGAARRDPPSQVHGSRVWSLPGLKQKWKQSFWSCSS